MSWRAMKAHLGPCREQPQCIKSSAMFLVLHVTQVKELETTKVDDFVFTDDSVPSRYASI